MDTPSTSLEKLAKQRQQLHHCVARISRQRRELRRLNRSYDRLRDSNSVLRHMLEVSEQTRKSPNMVITLPKDVQPRQAQAFAEMMAAHPEQQVRDDGRACLVCGKSGVLEVWRDGDGEGHWVHATCKVDALAKQTGVNLKPWQRNLIQQALAKPPGTRFDLSGLAAHTMGRGRDYSKPMNHNHVKPCNCGIFDREKWDMANPKLDGNRSAGGLFIMDEHLLMGEGGMTTRSWGKSMIDALDAPWYRRAWDWLVFHTTRAFTPDEVDDWSMPIYVIMQNNGKPVAAYTSKSEAEDIAKDMWRYPAGTSFAVNKVELY